MAILLKSLLLLIVIFVIAASVWIIIEYLYKKLTK